jgi:O-antigen/teichoic acid export membrane protein
MRSLKTDTLLNLLGAGLPVLVAIPTVPLYLQTIGQERYGVLAICWILVGYFAFFDFGMGKAVNQRISASPEQAEKVLWMGLLLSGCLGILGGILVLLGGVLLENIRLSQELLLELRSGLPWLVLAVFALIMTSVLQGVLEARRDFLAANVVTISANGLLPLLPLIAAFVLGSGLENLLFATALARALTLFVAIWFNRRLLQKFVSFPLAECTKLLQFGGWVTVTGIVGPLLMTADQVLIGVRIGANALAIYNISYNVVTRAAIIGAAYARALFPRFAKQNPIEAKRTRTKALLFLSFVMTALTLAASVLVKPIFIWWLGAETATQAIPVALVLLFGVWINALAFVPFVWLQATGRPDIPARFHLAELIPYGLILWLLLPALGIIGAALSWAIRTTIDTILLLFVSQDFHLFVLIQGILVFTCIGAGLSGVGWVQGLLCVMFCIWLLISRPWKLMVE